MVRKNKDLFVILAERQQDSKSKGGRDTGAAVREVGGTLGRWVQGAVKTMRPDRDAKGKAKGKSRGSKSKARETSSASRRTAPRQVPRGLLMPGWLLVGMVTAGLGCGFLIGRYTSDIRSDSILRGLGGGMKKPEAFDRKVADLSEVQESEALSGQFYVCGTYFPEKTSGLPEARAKAATLARRLRDHGISNARIREFPSKDGSTSAWATLCYAASSDGDTATLEALKGLQGVLRFELLLLKGSYLHRPLH